MDSNNKRKKYVKIEQNTRKEKVFTMLDEVGNDLEDDIDELVNGFDKECAFEKADSEKDGISDDQPKNILIPKSKHSRH